MEMASKLNRRGFLSTVGLSLAALAGSRWSLGADTDKRRPNLLIIQTDEHNFRTLGCYRDTLTPEQAFMWGKNSVVETPNIDWIARNGVLCTKFYASTPLCSPSRASFVSGRYPQNTPVTNNNIALADDTVTFAEILRREGYTTGYAGKWHLDGQGKPQWAPERKFGFEDNRYMFNRGHWKKLTDTPEGPKVDTGDEPTYDVKDATEENFTTDWLTSKTLDFLKANRENPFCYMLSIPDPHGPDTVREPYASQYKDMQFEPPRTLNRPAETAPSWAKPGSGKYDQSKYYGMVKCIDDNVGRILEHLRESGLIGHTIVVFTADHGDMRGEHHRHDKEVPMEASAKVPFLVYYPEKIQRGTRVDQALAVVDFLPTILSLMGVKTAGTEEGRDASVLLTGGAVPPGWQDVVFVRGSNNWLGAFTSRFKLVVSSVDEPWLMDLEKDPDELINFIANPEYAAVARNLAIQLQAYGKKYNDGRIGQKRIPEDIARLVEER